MAGRDIYKAINDLPFRRFALAQLHRVTRLARKVGVPAIGFDQYPGKEEPAAYSCWYGPIPMQTPRRLDDPTGFPALAKVVTPDTPYLPIEGNPLTGHDYAFNWDTINVSAYLKWGYTSGGSVPVDPRPLGDLFDPAIGDNGGGQVWQNFSQAFGGNAPRICFELDLYDRKRGRSITDGRIPSESFLGLAYQGKDSFGGMRWDFDTEIEPRLYITEVRMTDILDTAAAFNAAQVAVYINLAFFGSREFSEHPSGAGPFDPGEG